MEANKPLAPIISFEKKPVEDRDMSIKTGRKVLKDVDYITFIPHGSGGKTKVEYVYTEWVERIQQEVDKPSDEYNPSRFPQEWFDKIKDAYRAWQADSGADVMTGDGMALKNWPAITPAEYLNCKANFIYTVEQLAAANDNSVDMLGMGGRALVMRARATLAALTPSEQAASQALALKIENERLQAENERLLALLQANADNGIDSTQGTGAPSEPENAKPSADMSGKKPNGDKVNEASELPQP